MSFLKYSIYRLPFRMRGILWRNEEACTPFADVLVAFPQLYVVPRGCIPTTRTTLLVDEQMSPCEFFQNQNPSQRRITLRIYAAPLYTCPLFFTVHSHVNYLVLYFKLPVVNLRHL